MKGSFAAEPFEQHDQRPKRDDGHDDPAHDHDPAATEGAPASILAGEAYRPDPRTAFGEHAAIAANRLMATGARTGGDSAAAHASGDGRAAAVGEDQTTGHGLILA